jgi:Tol biopolymer transport system component/predicted Ser/Thr protein kinase
MNEYSLDRVLQVCERALARPPAERGTFLAEACAGDVELRRAVDALLVQESGGSGFLERPAWSAERLRLPLSASPTRNDPMVGRTLKHYRIEGKLGEGGMGVVYRAHDTHLERPVSIKVLPPGRTADPERRRRFAQEAKAASALNHPNILHIYDIDTADDVDFIAMEFVDGRTLDEVIAGRGLKLNQALQYAVQIADALGAAHAAGIVHRDIKPSNIMVNREGLVKILDFGLAKLSEAVEDDPSAPTQTMQPRTETGAIVGTVAYMSPEQAEGGKADARSDIFSFGLVLYEMVTGRRAFQGDTKIAILSAILHKEPPPISQISKNTPLELERIVARCLRKDPARRTQHIVDVRSALEELRDEAESGPQEQILVARAHSWRRWVPAALLVVVPVAGFIAWQAWRATSSEGTVRAVALTTFSGIEWWPSLSPDGNNVAFMWTGPKQDNPDIYVQMIGSAGRPLQLTTDPRADYNPVWSPDGRWIAFLRAEQLPRANGAPADKSELWLITPLGGPEHRLAEIQARAVDMEGFLAWCPDSSCLVVTDSPGEGKPDALFVVSRETGEKTQLTSPRAPLAGDTNPAVSPDGRWLVFRRESTFSVSELYVFPLRTGTGLTVGGEPTRLTRAAPDAQYPAWMPDSKEILFSAEERLWRMPISGEKPPAQLPFVGENGLMPVVSRAQPGRPARLVYARSFVDSNIWRVDTSAPGGPALSSPVVAISSTRMDMLGDLSPDGQRVAFTSTRTGRFEVWVADPDGANAVPLTSTASGLSNAPRWSPDGQWIAFQSSLEGQFEIYVIPANGGRPRRITSHPANDLVPSFSRDGQWIYFSSNRTGVYQIWKVSARGGDAVQVTHGEGYWGVEGMDGTYLYYMQIPRGMLSALWRIPTSGGQPVRILEGVLHFAVIDSGIYYLDRPGGEARLEFLAFATGKSTTVARNLGDVQPLLTASRDGRTIFFTRRDSYVHDLMLVDNFK